MQENDNNNSQRIKRYIDGVFFKDDLNTLSDPFLDPSSLLENMEESWADSEEIQTSTKEYETYKQEARALLNTLQKKKKKYKLSSIMKYAAAIALFLISGFGVLMLALQSNTKQQELVYHEVYVPKGEQKKLILPDSSQITLNSNSYIRYPSTFSDQVRKIEINGEVFLDVKPDKYKQFIVSTQDMDVKVLGTSFNIKAYDYDPQISVSVCTGKVQVEMPEANISISPDEMVTLNKINGEIEKRCIDSKKTTAWLRGELYFNKTPISIIAKELERYYNCEIEIENEELMKELVYGEHSNESLESVLKSLEYALNIKHKKKEDIIILYKD